jgi:D-alanyl-D-alanine dipeptidase
LGLLLLFACKPDKEGKGAQIEKRHDFIAKDTLKIILKNKINVDTSYLEYVFKGYDLIDVQSIDSSIKVDLKYASTDNFLKLNVYDGLRKAYFPCEVAIRIYNAQYYLKQINPNYSLIIFDATRPLHVQQMMWDSLDMPPDIKYAYLSPPFSISLHNYGCAVDLSIIDLKTNKVLDMGTEFDHFGKLSQPVYEWQYLKTGELTQEAFENRKLLRKVMQLANFFPITSEWWHFNFCNKEFAAVKYKLIK